MKAIILAAGKGSRLSKYTRDIPKGMIKFAGKTLLEHQIDGFRKCGINDIIIVVGYQRDKIIFDNVKYFSNIDFENTNMVESLMCAEEELNDDCIVTYSDLILEEKVINIIIKSKFDIGVAVDENFEEYWRCRLGSLFIDDMESLVIHGNRIVSIGAPNPDSNEVDGRYVGTIKFSKKGIKELIRKYKENKSTRPLSSLGNRQFEKWHMTDLLQSLIEGGFPINSIIISRGWLEFDTDNDYELYREWYQKNSLSRFINL